MKVFSSREVVRNEAIVIFKNGKVRCEGPQNCRKTFGATKATAMIHELMGEERFGVSAGVSGR